nr:MAG TPA: hypothetical protein [Caudoviricetes sp.]
MWSRLNSLLRNRPVNPRGDFLILNFYALSWNMGFYILGKLNKK